VAGVGRKYQACDAMAGRGGGGIHRNKESGSEKRGQSGPMLYRTEGEGSFLNNKKLYNPLDN
jgi:hypothetical protein